MASKRTLILVAGLLAAAALLIFAPAFALAMAPAIALFALLSQRVMPGEARLVRILSRHRVRRRIAVAPVLPPATVLVRRTGRLIAFALATHPPPASALLHV